LDAESTAITAEREPGLRDLPFEVWILVSIAFVVAIGFGILVPTLPLYAKSFGVSTFWASTVISGFALMRFLWAPVSGTSVNRFGERAVLYVGITLVGVSSLLAGLAHAFVWVVILRGLGGIGSSMFTVAAFALLLRVTDPRLRGRASGTYTGGFVLGGLFGPVLGSLVVTISLRAPFFVYAGFLFIAAAVAFFGLRGKHLEERAAAVELESGVQDEKEGWGSFFRAIKNSSYLAALLVNFGVGFVIFGMRNTITPLFVVHDLGLAAAAVGIGYTFASITQAALLIPFGRITDLVGRKFSMVLGSAIMIVSVFVLAFSHNRWEFFLAMALGGAAGAFLSSAPSAVVGDVTGGRRAGPLLAGFQMMSDLGGITGPLLAGAIADKFTNSSAFVVGGAFLVIPLIASIKMRETKGLPAPEL
jgi:MFS family permease